ncbi:hypothetical protein WSM22_47730 [Cytophagales bacterium WSM2-2]|nr:hypothetical protein WSM22_47730 [Cytophagales bacterium WSM2-2]
MRSLPIAVLVAVICFNTQAQTTIRANVIDSLSRQPVAFANISLEDGRTGTTAEIEGKFVLNIPTNYSGAIFVSHVTYQRRVIPLSYFKNHQSISLLPASNVLQEVAVTAKKEENPAFRIIRQAVAHKKDHDPDYLKSYEYISYNKFLVTMSAAKRPYDSVIARIKNPDSVKQVKARKEYTSFDSLLRTTHFFLSESVTEKQKINPNKEKEKLLALQVSGFKSPLFTNVATDYQPFSFYKDNISLLGKDYINPVSRGTFGRYEFILSDTTYDGNDTTYIIKYHPKTNSFFNGLKGVLSISTDGFAIKNVIASSTDSLAFINILIQQNYEKINNQWFPVQLNTDMRLYQYKYFGRFMMMQHRSFLKEIKINPPLRASAFGDVKLELTIPKAEENKSTLDRFRNVTLDHKEARTYKMMDSIVKKTSLRIDDIIEMVVTQAVPLGLLELDLNRISKINQYESIRLGAGVFTSDRFSKWFRLGGYAGYGFRDQQWKYGGDVRFNFSQNKDFFIKFSYSKDIYETGMSHINNEGQLLGSESFRTWNAYQYDRVEFYKGEIGYRIFPDVHATAFVSRSEITPTYNYQLQLEGETLDRFRVAETGITMRYVHDESYMSLRGKKVFVGQRFPVFTLSVSKAAPLYDAQNFTYSRADFTAKLQRKHRYGGKTRFFLTAGWIDGIAPYGKLYNGRGARSTSYLVENFFQSMGLYEFTASKYASVFMSHNFGNVLLNKKFSKPELVLYHHMGIGQLDNQQIQSGIPMQGFDKGYVESGLGLNNLIRGNYAKVAYWGFGGALFYRYGPYQFAQSSDNLVARMNFSLTF